MFLDRIKIKNVSNKVLYLLAQKSTTFKSCSIISLLCLSFAAWLFIVANPLKARMNAGQVTLKKLHHLKNSCSQSYDQCADLSQKFEHLNLKINKKINVLGNSSAYRSLGKIIECIHANNVVLIDYSPGKVEKLPKNLNFGDDRSSAEKLVTDEFAKNKSKSNQLKVDEFGKKVSFELTLEGTFINMLNFFKCLSAIKYCLKYNQIYITKNEQGLIGCKLLLDILQV